MIKEFLTSYPDALKLLVSLALGSAIGLEREVSDKAAGLRTNILICLGATLFTIISLRFYDVHDAHIVAQIVAGIGFLGAGAIMRQGEHVTGLTTAATIWIVAAIGMGVGFGYYGLSAAVTVIVLVVQLVFTKLDILIDDIRQRHTYRIVSKPEAGDFEDIEAIFREARVKVMRRKLMKKDGCHYSEWYTSGPRTSNEQVMRKLLLSKHVVELNY